MKKYKLYFVVFFIFLCYRAIPQSTFQKCYSVQFQTGIIDGNKVIYLASPHNGENRQYIITTDLDGNVINSVYIDSLSSLNIIKNTNNNYILCGVNVFYDCRTILFFFDTNFTYEYSKKISMQGYYNIVETRDSGYLIYGTNLDEEDIFFIKTNNNFDTLWTRKISFSNGNYSNFNTIITKNNEIMFLGCITDSLQKIALIKMDSLGNIIFSKKYSYHGEISANEIAETEDNCFLICGSSRNSYINHEKGVIIKVDSMGNFIFAKTYGGSGYDELHGIKKIKNDAYLCYGMTSSFGSGSIPYGTNFDRYLLEINDMGDTLLTRAYGTTDDGEYLYDILISDSAYYMVGDGFIINNLYTYLIKTDNNFWSGCNEFHTQTEINNITLTVDTVNISCSYFPVSDSIVILPIHQTTISDSTLCFSATGIKNEQQPIATDVSVYPNPNNGNMTVAYKIPANTTGSFELYDIIGKKLLSSPLYEGKNTFNISATMVNAGIYFYRITAGNKLIAADKIVVIK
jgi:hypothetical protein